MHGEKEKKNRRREKGVMQSGCEGREGESEKREHPRAMLHQRSLTTLLGTAPKIFNNTVRMEGRENGGIEGILSQLEERTWSLANIMIKEEIDFLRVALGHENEFLDEFVKAHDACQEDLMYLPTRVAYGLSSVADNMEKLTALQNEFENVKNRMDDETKKVQCLEQKIKLLTHGYQVETDFLNHEDGDNREDLDEQIGEDEVGEGSTLHQPAYPWEGSDPDYKYEELLDRVFNVLCENNPEFAGDRRRLVLRPPQVLREGTKKIVFVNFMETCKTYVIWSPLRRS